MNEAYSYMTAEDFREVFLDSVFDYLNENGINLSNMEDVIARYQENKVAHSINMGILMVMERIVDKLLLSKNVLNEDELGTELDSNFSIQVNPSTGKPAISSKYKLQYKKKNIHLNFDCQIQLDDIYDNEILDEMIRKIILDAEKQLSH